MKDFQVHVVNGFPVVDADAYITMMRMVEQGKRTIQHCWFKSMYFVCAATREITLLKHAFLGTDGLLYSVKYFKARQRQREREAKKEAKRVQRLEERMRRQEEKSRKALEKETRIIQKAKEMVENGLLVPRALAELLDTPLPKASEETKARHQEQSRRERERNAEFYNNLKKSVTTKSFRDYWRSKIDPRAWEAYRQTEHAKRQLEEMRANGEFDDLDDPEVVRKVLAGEID